MSTQILTGIGLTVTSAWLYGFGTVFVQALDQTIPVFELNTLRLTGKIFYPIILVCVII